MIFFDIDGTLLDHRKSESMGAKEFFKHFETSINDDFNNFYTLWCNTTKKYFQKFLNGELTYENQRIERVKDVFAKYGETISNEEASKRFKYYLQAYEYNLTLFEDVFECLERMKEFRLGVISNGDKSHQELKLKKMGIEKYFEVVITAGEVGVAKPDRRIFELACKKAKVSMEGCYYIGDEFEVDIKPCKNIGFKGIWINRSLETSYDYNLTINDLSYLPELLKTHIPRQTLW